MHEEINFCPHCGANVNGDSTTCPCCGNCIGSTPVSGNTAVNEKKGKKISAKIISVIVSVVVIMAGRFVGGLVAENTLHNSEEKKLTKDIREFQEKIDKGYTPGKMVGKTYISEHFDLVFDFDSNWTLMTEEELETVSSDAWEGGVSNATQYMEEENLPDSLKDELIGSFNVNAEMGANYVSNGIPVANVTVITMSIYGTDYLSLEDILDNNIREYKDTFGYAKGRTELIGGERYEVIEASLEEEGVTVNLAQYMREEDSVICVIQYCGVDGYDDEAEESFMEMFKN